MLKVENAETNAAIIQDEIRRNPEARYEHRLHAVLLVSQGMSCVHVARLMGDSVLGIVRGEINRVTRALLLRGGGCF